MSLAVKRKKKLKLRCFNKTLFCVDEKDGRCLSKEKCEWKEKTKFEVPAVVEPKPEGRLEYSTALVDRVCDLIAGGMSVNQLVQLPGMPKESTFYAWLNSGDKEYFVEKYARAISARTIRTVEAISDIDDKCIATIMAESEESKRAGAIVSAYKGKTDNIKWVASKLLPAKYGNNTDITSGGKPLLPTIVINTANPGVAQRMREIVEEAGAT